MTPGTTNNPRSGEPVRLQQFGFAESQYERPNQPWVCGRLCNGRPCHIGPDAKGNCLATSECHPVRKGDRWHCTRPASRGGACDIGPLPDGSCCKSVTPCQPVRSVRGKRGQVVFWSVAASLGILAAILFSPARMSFIQPGELSSAHGQVLKDTAACSQCHTAAGSADSREGSTPDAWLTAALGASTSAIAESENCLKCHRDTPGLRVNPLNPHSIDPQRLAASHDDRKPAAGRKSLRWMLASLGPDVPETHDKQIACATCHVEHRGKDHRLAHMSNQQCQACHQAKFNSLADGHPEFTRFTYDKRTPIVFDHEGHTRYSQQKTKSFDCASCHQPDVSGRHMITASFAAACSSCHASQMENPGKGLMVLHLPGMDVDTLKEFAESGGPWMGVWPKGADYDIDGKLSPFMRLLLASDTKVAAALAAIPAKMQLNDLTGATKEQKEAAVAIAWGVKELFHDLATRGHEALRERLAKSLATTIDARELAALTAELPADTTALAQQRWLPDVLETVPLHRAGKPIPETPVKKVAPPPPPIPPPTPKPKANDLFDDEPAPPKPPVPPASKPKPADLFDCGGDLFDDEDDAKPAVKSPAAQPATKKPDLFDDDDDDVKHPAPPAAPAATVAPPAIRAPLLPPEQRALAGGWYLDDDTFAIRYRSVGHANAFIRQWLATTARATSPDSAASSPGKAAFDALRADAGASCVKCHSVDAVRDGAGRAALMINWTPKQRAADERPFVKFNHRPHRSLPELADCKVCHTMTKSDVAAKYGSLDPHRASPQHAGFAPLTVQKCATCHQPNLAGDSCLKCHNYHITR